MNKAKANKKLVELSAYIVKKQQDAKEEAKKVEALQDFLRQALTLVPKEVQYTSLYSFSLGFTVQVKGFNTAKTKKLLESFMRLDLGGKIDMDSNDYPQYNQRSYSFKYFKEASTSIWYPDFTVTITCELIEGGTACRRVQVGEKVETIKTLEYVFVCK
jgi:hypothetical protein